MSDLERKGKNATQCRKNQSNVFPKVMSFQKLSRPAMPENDHEKSMVIKCGQHRFTSFPCSKTISNPQRDLINTQDLFPHFCKR